MQRKQPIEICYNSKPIKYFAPNNKRAKINNEKQRKQTTIHQINKNTIKLF